MKAKTVTIFGGSGFLGRYVVEHLAEAGWTVRVASRNPVKAAFLKPLGKVGQIVPIGCNIQNPKQVDALVDGADAVIDLVGILYEKGGQTFQAVHVDGARHIAQAVKNHTIQHFVHVSAIGASSKSPSRYAQTKAEAEKVVHDLAPHAVILRPSIIFGPEDSFFNLFAGLSLISPALPLIGGGKTRFQPVYVGDVADAVMKVLEDKKWQGEIFELGGPKVYTFKELMKLMLDTIDRHRLLVPLPFALARVKAFFLEFMPRPLLTRDQVKLLEQDNVVSGETKTFEDLGLKPTSPKSILPTYLDRFQSGGPFSNRRRRSQGQGE